MFFDSFTLAGIGALVAVAALLWWVCRRNPARRCEIGGRPPCQ